MSLCVCREMFLLMLMVTGQEKLDYFNTDVSYYFIIAICIIISVSISIVTVQVHYFMKTV